MTMAGLYARLRMPDSAARWLAVVAANRDCPCASWTARAFAIEPRLRELRGTPAFERFLRERRE